MRKHRLNPDRLAIGVQLLAAEKRDEIVQIKAFSCRNALRISNENNAEMDYFSLFHGPCFLMRNEPRMVFSFLQQSVDCRSSPKQLLEVIFVGLNHLLEDVTRTTFIV